MRALGWVVLGALLVVPRMGLAVEVIDDEEDAAAWPEEAVGAPASAVAGAGPATRPPVVRLSLDSRLSLDLHSDPPPGLVAEDLLALDLALEAHVAYQPRSWIHLVVGGRLDYRLTARAGEGASSPGWNLDGGVHRSVLEVVPGEAYAHLKGRWLDLHIGMVSEVWGATDLTSPNDVLTLRDLRDGPPADPRQARLPVPMVRGAAHLGPVSWTVVWMPVHLPHRVDAFGSDTAMLSTAVPAGLRWVGPALEELAHDSVEHLWQPALLQTELPRPVRDSSLATRVAVTVAGTDMAVQYAYLYERTPVLRVDPTLLGYLVADPDPPSALELSLALSYLASAERIPLELAYQRQHAVGLSVTRPVWELLLSFDLAYLDRAAVVLDRIPLPSYNNKWSSISKDSRVVASSAGATYTRGESWLVTLEGWYRVEPDVDDSDPLLLGGPHHGGLALLARYHHPGLGLTGQVAALTDLANPSLVLQAQVTYRPWSHLDIYAGVRILEGQANSVATPFDHEDRVFVGFQTFL